MSGPEKLDAAALKERLGRLSASQRAQLLRRLADDRSPAGNIPRSKPLKVLQPAGVVLHAVSLSQQRAWFLHRFASGSAVYNSPIAFRLLGPVDASGLQAAFLAVIQRHDVLRTTFGMEGLELCQRIAPASEFRLKETSLENVPWEARLAALQPCLDEEASRPFDLATGPLVRATLVRLGPAEHYLVVVLHHIISDGWSRAILCRELSLACRELAAARPPQLPSLPLQFADFSAWQKEWLKAGPQSAQVAYWKSKLSDLPGPLDLPADRPRPAAESFRGGRCAQPLDSKLAELLKLRAQEEGATFFMVLLAAFKTLLFRYTGQTDLLVGVPVAGRPRPELEELIGFFANTLVMRTQFQPDITFRELLRRVKETALDAYANQHTPIEQLVNLLRIPRDTSRNPLFQTAFTVQDFPEPKLDLPGIAAAIVPVSTRTSKFDFTLTMERAATGWLSAAEYSADLFDHDRIERLLGHWRMVLESIAANPDQRIADIGVLTAAEKKQILGDWNQTDRDFPRDKCLHQLFEDQARLTPDRPAAEFQGRRLTYRQLNESAGRLAARLRSLAVGPDVPVGLCVERSLELLVGMLGILKAGGAYVPLDPSYPAERIDFILQDAGATVLVTRRHLHFGQGMAHRVLVDEAVSDENTESSAPNVPPPANLIASHASRLTPSPSNLAYVMYTSGSTGKPKGVAIEHRGVVSFVTWVRDTFSTAQLSRVLASTSICFDLSVFEIFSPLSWGGTVVVADSLLDLVSAQPPGDISLINTVQSVLLELFRTHELPPSIRAVNMGGEALRQPVVEAIFKKSSAEQVNDLYGPTETTIYSTWARRMAGGFENVGRPISNTQLYILDPHGQPLPVGIQGELYIGGLGVARGYWRRPELTAGRFVPDPFSHRPGARLFKTGDRARWLPDGTLVLLGRADGLVKLHAFRIELGEIEASLRAWPEVREAAVVLREDAPGGERLVAYLVSQNGRQPDVSALRNRLAQTLPAYMVPAAFVWLERFPLTPNGKIDRKSLPAPTLTASADPVVIEQPATILELELVRIWQRLFGRNAIGRNDNFFDLGGNSFLAIRFVGEIEKFAGRQLPVAALFQAPTVAALARKLEDENWIAPRTSLVPLQSQGSQLPLFCLHGIYGEVFVFLDLARQMASHRPVYGLQAVGLDGQHPRHTSVEEMAVHYAREIRSVQPEGPYHLVGASLGGWIAHAVAQELTRQGATVALLALLDTRATARVPWYIYARAMTPHLAGRIGFHLKEFFRGHAGLPYLAEKFKWFKLHATRTRKNLPVRPANERLNDANRHDFTIDYFETIVARYRPRKVPANLTVFAGRDARFFPHARFWKNFTSARVNVKFVPGGHGTLIHAQHVAEFVRIFEQSLREAEADAGFVPSRHEIDTPTMVLEGSAT